MSKTIAEINEKIKKGKVVVVTAEEVIALAKEKGIRKAAVEIDVVTTGTFGPMCSSGAFLNTGHSNPRIKLGGGKVYLNDIPVYTGIHRLSVSHVFEQRFSSLSCGWIFYFRVSLFFLGNNLNFCGQRRKYNIESSCQCRIAYTSVVLIHSKTVLSKPFLIR